MAELTMVDGIIYYDLKQDEEMREWIRKERARLVEKIMKEKSIGKKAADIIREI